MSTVSELLSTIANQEKEIERLNGEIERLEAKQKEEIERLEGQLYAAQFEYEGLYDSIAAECHAPSLKECASEFEGEFRS